MIGKLFESLPRELQEAYHKSPKRGSKAQLAMKIIVARHLWELGFRRVKFEKPLTLPGGEVILIDVHEEERNLYIECETLPRRSEIKKRVQRIKAADPSAKYVLALPDYMGYEGERLEDLVEVWVVCRDGRVLKPKEWVKWRKNYLLEAANPKKLALLLKYYESEREFIRYWDKVRKGTQFMFSAYMKATASIVGDESWLHGLSIRCRLDSILEFSRDLIKDVKAELLAEMVEITNRLMSLNNPYRLRLNDDGSLSVEFDFEDQVWLGEADALAYSKNTRKRAKHLKATMRELQMLSKYIKPKIQECMQTLTELSIGELCHILNRGEITIQNKKLLEKLGLNRQYIIQPR